MSSENLIEELISSTSNDKQKRILSLFIQGCTPKKLKEEVDRQIQEELDDA